MNATINVAVAIIYFGDKYLLGYRNASQHQGKKYEFIGGKIEPTETPKQGLMREVLEEIGCDISANTVIKMGVIRHDYDDKSVALHCFKIKIHQSQFDRLQSGTGTEGQPITWVSKADLLANKYPLPDANVRIVDWLEMPDVIFISQALTEHKKDWVNFYSKKLPQQAHFYCRMQADEEQSFVAIAALLAQRSDSLPLIPVKIWQQYWEGFESKNCIVHVNHAELMALGMADLPSNQRYFASCHDKNSLSKVNDLAKTHTVMGCFLSPVLATPTHPETITNGGLGWQAFGELAASSDVPVYGLGGLNQQDLAKVWENNGFGVAGIRLLH